MIQIPYQFNGTVQYQHYAEVVERIKKFANHKVLGYDQSGTYEIYTIELGRPENPTLYISASMHGIEWQAAQYTLRFFEMLRDNTFPDQNLRDDLLNNFHVVYIPVLNPWGWEDITDPYNVLPGRYNSTGADLNRDFEEFTQAESRLMRDSVLHHKPFAYFDAHLFGSGMEGSGGHNLIVGNGQPETYDLRDLIIDSLGNYAGQPVQTWGGGPNLGKGLSREFVRDQSNPYTPYTLSYIHEIVRPIRRVDGMDEPLTPEQIYKFGTACLYLFFKTSFDYLREHWQPEQPIDLNVTETRNILVRDKNMKKIGELENAYTVPVKRTVNEVWQSSFKLPADDPKNHLCSHFNFIEMWSASGRYYGMYRIMPAETKKSESDDSITYECEHVLSTLMDDVMEGYHQFSNYDTRYVLQSILNLQEIKHWDLGEVEFTRFFHYSFENENGLLAPILSIPKPFNEAYEFTFDTTVYPWKLNLVRADKDVKSEIRWGKDMISFDEVSDPSEIVNHIIPKGSGEGVNQLTIEDVNDGKRYLEDVDSIAEWGKKKYIWIDRRFSNVESLKETGQSLLNQWKDPKISFEAKSADLSILPEYRHEGKILNGVTRITVEEKEYLARIIGDDHSDILGKEHDVSYEINNRLDDIATTQADMERKQQVNDAYSMGATNILSFNYQDNCDNNIPAVIPFYIDDDVRYVNTCELTFRTNNFRAYSTATHGGGAVVESTSAGGGTTRSTTSGGSVSTSTQSGGGSTQTSSSGGGTSKSTASGGSTTKTSSASGDHRHVVFTRTSSGGPFDLNTYAAAGGSLLQLEASTNIIETAGSSGNHSHSVSVPSHVHNFTVPDHQHSVNIPSHSHNFTVPSHSHDVTIPAHTHDIELPDHTHEVKHEIVELNDSPSNVTIKVDGNRVNFNSTSGDRIDLIDYLEKDSSGKVTRGRHKVELLPDSLARIEADLILRVFIQSHLGQTL